MLFNNVSIAHLTHVEAPIKVKSSEIEAALQDTISRLKLPENLLSKTAGVQERRWWQANTKPSDAATLAAEKLLSEINFDRSKIGLLINSSVSRDFVEPSTACAIHANLKLAPTCINFDLGNACLAFLDAMNMASTMIEQGHIDNALIVNGECCRPIQEITIDRLKGNEITVKAFKQEFATLTLGSGSVAMLLCHKKHAQTPHYYRGGSYHANTRCHHLCQGQVDMMLTDTKALLKEAMKLAKQSFKTASELLHWSKGCLNTIIMHQVSSVHTKHTCKTLQLDIDKVFSTFPLFGNIGPASIPFALSKAIKTGRIKTQQTVGLLGMGSGLNSMVAELQW